MNLGGEKVLQSVLSETTFGGLRNWGWSGRCLSLLREMTESRQKRGGETYRRWGVQKRFLGRGFSPSLRYVFHPPEFSTPLGRSLNVHARFGSCVRSQTAAAGQSHVRLRYVRGSDIRRDCRPCARCFSLLRNKGGTTMMSTRRLKASPSSPCSP